MSRKWIGEWAAYEEVMSHTVEAPTAEEARKEFETWLRTHTAKELEQKALWPNTITVRPEDACFEVVVDPIRTELLRKEADAKKAAAEAKERAMYEQLKLKYEGNKS